jgi:hypothetical protein
VLLVSLELLIGKLLALYTTGVDLFELAKISVAGIIGLGRVVRHF